MKDALAFNDLSDWQKRGVGPYSEDHIVVSLVELALSQMTPN
jgi:hypothetical protein